MATTPFASESQYWVHIHEERSRLDGFLSVLQSMYHASMAFIPPNPSDAEILRDKINVAEDAVTDLNNYVSSVYEM